MIGALEAHVLRAIPEAARSGLADGSLRLFGSVIRNSNGSIAYHLQEAAPLARSIASGNPLGLITDGIQIVQNEVIRKGVGRIEEGIGVLTNLASANMALTAAGIGVSAAGFAIIKARLDGIEQSLSDVAGRLDHILDSIERVQHDRIEHDLGAIRGLLSLFEESWLLSNAGHAESNWRRVYQDGAGLQEIFLQRAEIAFDRKNANYLSAEPHLEAFALVSGLRIASLLACNEAGTARRVEEDSAQRLIQHTGSVGLIDFVGQVIPDNVRQGSQEWQLAQAQAREEMRPVIARIRSREQLVATRTTILPTLDKLDVTPREWLELARSEEAEPTLVLPPPGSEDDNH